jgi:hypothetical protein
LVLLSLALTLFLAGPAMGGNGAKQGNLEVILEDAGGNSAPSEYVVGFGDTVYAKAKTEGHWNQQWQKCIANANRGKCTTWANDGPPDTSNTTPPGTSGSLCGKATDCTVETVPSTKRYVAHWNWDQSPITTNGGAG